jgi:hypothetical protein
MDDLPEDD